MTPIKTASNSRMTSLASSSHQSAFMAGTVSNKWQCSANSVSDTDSVAAGHPTLSSNACHVSKQLQDGAAYSANNENVKTLCNIKKPLAIDRNSSNLVNDDGITGLLAVIKTEVLVNEQDSVSSSSNEICHIKVPPFKRKLSKRKHGQTHNCSPDKQDSTIDQDIPPLRSSRERKTLRKQLSQKVFVENDFSLANVKTEPEDLFVCDGLESNLHSTMNKKRKKTSEKIDVAQGNCRDICSAVISNSVEPALIKEEPVEEPLYDMPCTSSTSDLLAENVKEEQDEDEDFIHSATRLLNDASDDGDSALTPSGKKKVNSSSKYLLNAYNIISNLVHNLHAPLSIIDGAFSLFNKVVSGGLLRGRAAALIASSCVYFVCRQDGVPRTFQEIAAISNVSKKELGRSFKLILKGLDTSLNIVKTDDFMWRFCHVLGLGDEVVRAAEFIAKEAARMDLVPGRTPVSVAAAAIYMAAQASAVARTALEISKATGISDTTVLVVYRSIYPYAKELFPPNFKFGKSIENLTTTRMIF